MQVTIIEMYVICYVQYTQHTYVGDICDVQTRHVCST